ncbi:MAG: DUF927 domain-containing protein [Planctomycetia bacterium]|nr:DUF927 domain-containing protein [Planctomycetia bacterium]
MQTTLPDAPVPTQAVTPPNWLLGPRGLAKVCKGQEDLRVCSMPLVITRLMVNDAEDTVAVELAWKRNGNWKTHGVARSEIAAKHRIIDRADHGLAVTTGNADPMIDYLAQFESVNLHLLPQIQVRRQLGWVDNAKSGFLWGRSLLRVFLGGIDAHGHAATEDDPFANIGPAEESQPDAQQVFFQGADGGDEQIVDGFHAEGTFEEWAKAIEPALLYPKVKLVMLASLASPLLSILGVKNFIVDLCGPSSKGKTITLRAGQLLGQTRRAGARRRLDDLELQPRVDRARCRRAAQLAAHPRRHQGRQEQGRHSPGVVRHRERPGARARHHQGHRA